MFITAERQQFMTTLLKVVDTYVDSRGCTDEYGVPVLKNYVAWDIINRRLPEWVGRPTQKEVDWALRRAGWIPYGCYPGEWTPARLDPGWTPRVDYLITSFEELAEWERGVYETTTYEVQWLRRSGSQTLTTGTIDLTTSGLPTDPQAVADRILAELPTPADAGGADRLRVVILHPASKDPLPEALAIAERPLT